jgi:hypothetical protein
MNDILSDYCDLPTGVFFLEFLPRHEISVWQDGIPVPATRWYGVQPHQNSITVAMPTSSTQHGSQTPVSVGCLVISDSQELSDQLAQMEEMRFVLRLTQYSGKRLIIGTPEEFVTLSSTELMLSQPIGAQGHRINFTGSFIRRPLVLPA